MKPIFQAAALGLALAGATVTTDASVPLPVAEQTAGWPSLASVLKKIVPAVVSISVKGPAAQQPNTVARKRQETRRAPRAPHAPDAPRLAAERQTHAAGSGVVFDARHGLIITNNHVIDHADEITVTLAAGREAPAKLVGRDLDTDVAVIAVQVDNLRSIPLGDSDQLEVGDFVLAIGNPFAIGQTVSAGIVSGLRRNNVGIEKHEDFIQTDAAIYPGNSGGALVDLRGDLIGINTAFIGAGSTNPGMGFAIPINLARKIVDRILGTWSDPSRRACHDDRGCEAGLDPQNETLPPGIRTGDGDD
jgi:S1-C subfamily serine protease